MDCRSPGSLAETRPETGTSRRAGRDPRREHSKAPGGGRGPGHAAGVGAETPVRPANTADADKIKIVYADLPAAVPQALAGATATSATGLFIAYVGHPLDVIVSAPGYADETVRIGSPNEPSTALVVLSKR